MTERGRSSARGLARRLFWPVRRVIAPGALQVPAVTAEMEKLHAALEECRNRGDRAEERIGALEQELRHVRADFRADLQEARGLNIRVAELTDVVTELVLPLHDRELNPEALRALRPETR